MLPARYVRQRPTKPGPRPLSPFHDGHGHRKYQIRFRSRQGYDITEQPTTTHAAVDNI